MSAWCVVALWVLQSGQHSIRTTPTVVLHAADDGIVPVSSAREFVEALRGAGGAVASVFDIYRDYPGILIVLISFWSGMG